VGVHTHICVCRAGAGVRLAYQRCGSNQAKPLATWPLAVEEDVGLLVGPAGIRDDRPNPGKYGEPGP